MLTVLENPRHRRRLEEALPRAGEAPVLVVTCSEASPLLERLEEEAGLLLLRVPGGEVDVWGVGEALDFALAEGGVRRLVVLGHSRCAHAPRPAPAAPSGPQSGYARLVRGAMAASLGAAAARAHTLRQLRALEAMPRVRAARSRGVLQLQGCLLHEESGALAVCEAGGEAFAPCQAPLATFLAASGDEAFRPWA